MEKTNTLIKETETEKSNTLYIFNGVDDFESFNEVKNYRVFRKKFMYVRQKIHQICPGCNKFR